MLSASVDPEDPDLDPLAVFLLKCVVYFELGALVGVSFIITQTNGGR
jgi:hypothetical protein